MSIYTTISVTAEAARERLHKEIETLSDEKLETLMDIVLEKECLNCLVVSPHAVKNDNSRI